MRLFLTTLLVLIWFASAAQYTPATVPNTKLVNNSYVSNPDGIINENTVARIDSILADVERKATAQVAVVILNSIGEADAFDFSQELFNLWGLGQGSNNNGLLILFVQDVHIVRFHTGYGLEGVLPDVVCKEIQRTGMVPEFKQGNFDSGMLYGVEEVGKILTDPNYKVELTAPEDEYSVGSYSAFVIFILVFFGPVFLIAWAVKSGSFADSKPASKTEFPEMRLKRNMWLIEFGGIPALIMLLFWFNTSDAAGGFLFLAIYFYLMLTVFHRLWRERQMIQSFIKSRKYFEITDYLRISQWYWLLIALIFPFPFLVYFPFHFVRKRIYRDHARQCKLCDGDMVKLSETADDQYLSPTKILEEEIKSVNYDVWQCKKCQSTEEWHYVNRFSEFKICPACKAVAYYQLSNRTLVSPTYTKGGSGEQIHACKACNKQVKSKYKIAMLVHSTSSSSSSGSSYSSGSSSSSSSGGSWGGGSSGGGGASSSW